MFMRRPGSPVTRLAEGDACHDASRLNVLSEEDIESALGCRSTGFKVQAGIALHITEGNVLQWMPFGDRSSDFCNVASADSGTNFDRRVARHIQRIVAPQLEEDAVDFDSRGSAQADQSGFKIVRRESER